MRSKNNKKSMYVHIIEPLDSKLRPIVAGPICATRPLSNIDILLKPFLLHVKRYVKDNFDFLTREKYEDMFKRKV